MLEVAAVALVVVVVKVQQIYNSSMFDKKFTYWDGKFEKGTDLQRARTPKKRGTEGPRSIY